MKAYHFNDGKCGHDDNRVINVGETLTVDGKPTLCKQGLHGSVCPRDALNYMQHRHINLDYVEITDEVIVGDDKIVGKSRKVIKRLSGDALHKTLVRFALDCANRVKHLMTDERSIKALEITELWLQGKTAQKEIYDVADAAKAAAYNAYAADSAAAAYNAANTAYSAANTANAAANAAKTAVSYAAERQWQRERFLEILEKGDWEK